MWIFLNNAFLSIVDKGGDGTTLLVRGRREGDIERVFPNAQVKKTPHNDYRHRALINRELIAKAIADSIRSITYSNFKGSVEENHRHEAYLDVWQAMYKYQRQI